jgi:hypothetical protein
MNPWLIIAAVLVVFIAAVHAILGERYIVLRLWNQDNLPKLLGSDLFTKRVLRFAWHLTTVAWFGFAAILLLSAGQNGGMNTVSILNVIGITFLLSALLSLIITRGRHISWIVFLAIAVTSWLGSQF